MISELHLAAGHSQLALLWAREGRKGLVRACHACFNFLHRAGHTGQQLHATISHHDVLLDPDLGQTNGLSISELASFLR